VRAVACAGLSPEAWRAERNGPCCCGWGFVVLFALRRRPLGYRKNSSLLLRPGRARCRPPAFGRGSFDRNQPGEDLQCDSAWSWQQPRPSKCCSGWAANNRPAVRFTGLLEGRKRLRPGPAQGQGAICRVVGFVCARISSGVAIGFYTGFAGPVQ